MIFCNESFWLKPATSAALWSSLQPMKAIIVKPSAKNNNFFISVWFYYKFCLLLIIMTCQHNNYLTTRSIGLKVLLHFRKSASDVFLVHL